MDAVVVGIRGKRDQKSDALRRHPRVIGDCEKMPQTRPVQPRKLDFVRIVELENGGLVSSRDRRQAISVVRILHSYTFQRNRAPWRASSFCTAAMFRLSNGSSRRSETAAAAPAPWPVTAQHIMLRAEACDTLSPPMQRPATSRLPTPLGTSDRYGTCQYRPFVGRIRIP